MFFIFAKRSLLILRLRTQKVTWLAGTNCNFYNSDHSRSSEIYKNNCAHQYNIILNEKPRFRRSNKKFKVRTIDRNKESESMPAVRRYCLISQHNYFWQFLIVFVGFILAEFPKNHHLLRHTHRQKKKQYFHLPFSWLGIVHNLSFTGGSNQDSNLIRSIYTEYISVGTSPKRA